MAEIYVGAFGAETAWRPARTAVLSPFRTDAAEQTAQLDEVMALACASGGRFIVREPPSSRLAACFRRAGLTWNPVVAAQVEAAHETSFAAEDRAVLFAVTSAAMQLCRDLGLRCEVPPVETVARVNSKSWSFRARARAGVNLGEQAGCSAEAGEKGARLLSRGPIFIKEAYGVSGLGNVLVDSVTRLDTVCRRLQQQEERGFRIDVVIEPTLDKLEDFSGHFTIARDGARRFLGFRAMVNVGTRYLASRAMLPLTMTDAARAEYHRVLDIVLASLFEEGYFGPVCVDGMLLAGGSVQPVVEVNARMSMGLLNLRLDEALSAFGLVSTLIKVRVQAERDRQSCLDALAELLPEEPGRAGILPVTSSAVWLPDRAADIVLALLYDTPEVERELCRSLDAAMRSHGLVPALPAGVADLLARSPEQGNHVAPTWVPARSARAAGL